VEGAAVLGLAVEPRDVISPAVETETVVVEGSREIVVVRGVAGFRRALFSASAVNVHLRVVVRSIVIASSSPTVVRQRAAMNHPSAQNASNALSSKGSRRCAYRLPRVVRASVKGVTDVPSAVNVKKTEPVSTIARTVKPASLFLTIHVLVDVLLSGVAPVLAMRIHSTPTVVLLITVSKHVESPSRQTLAPRNVRPLLKPDSLEVARQHALPITGRLALSQLNTTTVM
jgi:hypothetical protein